MPEHIQSQWKAGHTQNPPKTKPKDNTANPKIKINWSDSGRGVKAQTPACSQNHSGLSKQMLDSCQSFIWLRGGRESIQSKPLVELNPSGLSDFTKSAYRTRNPNTKHSSHLCFSLEMGVGKKYLLKILMARSWEGILMQLSPLCKYYNHQKIPRCPRRPPFLSHLLLTSRRGRGTRN